MKNILIRLISVFLFVIAAAYCVGMPLNNLFDLKYFMLLLISVAFMTYFEVRKFSDKENWKNIAGERALWLSFILSFLAIFVRLSKPIDTEFAREEILFCMRPILYGLCFRIILGNDKHPVPIKQANLKEETLKREQSIKAWLLKKGLSKRECEVTFLILDNLTNQEIAEELYLTENTIKKHNANLYKKLGINSREQLKYIIFENVENNEGKKFKR